MGSFIAIVIVESTSFSDYLTIAQLLETIATWYADFCTGRAIALIIACIHECHQSFLDLLLGRIRAEKKFSQGRVVVFLATNRTRGEKMQEFPGFLAAQLVQPSEIFSD